MVSKRRYKKCSSGKRRSKKIGKCERKKKKTKPKPKPRRIFRKGIFNSIFK